MARQIKKEPRELIQEVLLANGAEQTFGNDHCQYYLDIETVYGDWMHWGRYTSLEHVIRAATNTVYAYKKDNSLSGSFNIKKVGLT